MRWISGILVSAAIMILMAHSLVPHHHEEEVVIAGEDGRTGEEDQDHNLFSYANVAHVYTSTHSEIRVDHDLPLLAILCQCLVWEEVPPVTPEGFRFAFKASSPPPDQYFCSAARRGPPAV